MKLTVAVCTSGERTELIKTLESIQQASLVEVLLINNGKKKLSSFRGVRIINVPKAGLSRARNAGWQHASADFVAYIDDDAIASPDWVKKILQFIDKHPQVVAFGGPYTRHAIGEIPGWIPPDFGQMDWGGAKRTLVIGKEWLAGTNMVFSKKALHEVGGFDELLGMQGNKLNYGEEIDVQIKLAIRGEKLWYDPSIRVSHRVDQRKINMWWLCKDAYTRGVVSEKLKQSYTHFFESIQKHQSGRQLKTRYTIIQKSLQSILLLCFGLGVIKQKIWHA